MASLFHVLQNLFGKKMLEISSLTKHLGKRNVINNLSFCAQRQECIGLFGEHGAGKTILLNLISGLVKPSGGHINIQGFDTQTHPLQARKALGYQLQDGLNHHTMSVKDMLNFIAAIRGFSGAEKRSRVDRAAMRLELSRVLNAPLATLSSGLKRKVAIAQAILHTPSLLLLDEPTEGMATDQLLKFRTLIHSLTDEMTVIIASRHCNELSSICTRALVIAGGRLMADAPLLDLQRNSRHFRAVTLAAETPLDLLALAVLPGVAGIEEDRHAPGKVTVLAMPGHNIYPPINALIASRGWNITSLNLEPGRLNEVVHHLSQEVSPLKQLPVIFKRQFASYASTPGTYLSVAAFLVLCATLGLYTSPWLEQDSGDLQVFFQLHPWLYLLLIPAVSTQLWSDERNPGLRDVLNTLPITVTERVLGKFLAAWLVCGIALTLTFPIVVIANYLGAADNLVISSQFLASWLLAGSYLSVGCFICALTHRRMVSFLLTLGLLLTASALSSVLDALERQAPIWVIDSLIALNPISRFSAIDNGKLTLHDSLYFISMIIAFLSATIVTVNYKTS